MRSTNDSSVRRPSRFSRGPSSASAATSPWPAHLRTSRCCTWSTGCDPSTEIIFLDTGGHFPETLDFAPPLRHDWYAESDAHEPGPGAAASPCGTTNCCELRKVEPLGRALISRPAWITSVKRVDAPHAHAYENPDVGREIRTRQGQSAWRRGATTTWRTTSRATTYRSIRLWAQGYASIGCAAMTMKPQVPGDRRSGRWVGLDKDECGLHEA